MKLFDPSAVAPKLPIKAKLCARLVGLDIQLMRFARPENRAPFRAMLRASIKTLRQEIGRA